VNKVQVGPHTIACTPPYATKTASNFRAQSSGLDAAATASHMRGWLTVGAESAAAPVYSRLVSEERAVPIAHAPC